MGSITLRFDGITLTAYDNGAPVRTWGAISGNVLDGNYLNPIYTNLKDKGPIPEGSWVLDPAKYQSINDIGLSDYIKGALHRGPFPFNETAWGSARIELSPSVGTETYGRSGFFLHGGAFPGSAGCIDLLNETDFMNYIRTVGVPVALEVNYSPNYTGETHPFLAPQYNYPYSMDDYAEDVLQNLALKAGTEVNQLSKWVLENVQQSVLDYFLSQATNALLPGWVSQVTGPYGNAERAASPLVIDVDGDGIELSGKDGPGAVYWDLDQDGFREASGWIAGGDGLLALDRNGNGAIDAQGELFGTMDTDGFTVLRPETPHLILSRS